MYIPTGHRKPVYRTCTSLHFKLLVARIRFISNFEAHKVWIRGRWNFRVTMAFPFATVASWQLGGVRMLGSCTNGVRNGVKR